MVSSVFATENEAAARTGAAGPKATGDAVRLGGYKGTVWMVCVGSLLRGAVT